MPESNAVSAQGEYMSKKRQVLHDTVTLLRRWLSTTYLCVAIIAAACALSISKSHGVMFAHLLIVTVMVFVSGRPTPAAWLACVGSVCIEALGVVIVASQPAEGLEREVEMAAAIGTPMIMRATAWFGGGCAYGLQPLQTEHKRSLAFLGIVLIVLRLLVTCLRCSEGVGPKALTIVLPRTIVPLVVGFQVSHHLLVTWAALLTKLACINQDLIRTQGSWVALRELYSELYTMLSTVPEGVRMQYTGTDAIPNYYSATVQRATALEPRQTRGTCIICQSEPFTHLYTPCGHHCVCLACATRWDEKGSGLCPMCAMPYENIVRVYCAS